MYEGGSVIIPAENKISSRADKFLTQTKAEICTLLLSTAAPAAFPAGSGIAAL